MIKKLSKNGQTSQLITAVNQFVKVNEVVFYTVIILFTFINLVLTTNLASKVFRSNTVKLTRAEANLPRLKISQPANFSKVSGTFPVVLSYLEGVEGFSQVTLLVDGELVDEATTAGPAVIALTIDSKKFSNGPHKLTIKATDTKDRTQTLQLDLNFSNKKR